MKDVIKRSFEISVEGQSYKVHPSLLGMIELENKEEIYDILEQHSIPETRSVSLSVFLDSVWDKLKKDEDYQKKGVTKEALVKTLETSMDGFKGKISKDLLSNIDAELKQTEEELTALFEKEDLAKSQAKSYAKKVVMFGLTMCSAQLGGFAYLIYGLFSWDEIEPITYLTGAFYACVSMTFYLRYREDFEWANAMQLFEKRKLEKLCRKNGIDLDRLDFLRMYKNLLVEQSSYLTTPANK